MLVLPQRHAEVVSDCLTSDIPTSGTHVTPACEKKTRHVRDRILRVAIRITLLAVFDIIAVIV